MKRMLHITSGDIAGDRLAKSAIPGEVFVWHDILYNGPRKPGWPDDATLAARAVFLEASTGGGLSIQYVLGTLKTQYGVVTIRKAYGNWKNPSLKPWEDLLNEYAIQPIQQYDLTKGKNASDIALVIIDAMDIMYTKNIDVAVREIHRQNRQPQSEAGRNKIAGSVLSLQVV